MTNSPDHALRPFDGRPRRRPSLATPAFGANRGSIPKSPTPRPHRPGGWPRPSLHPVRGESDGSREASRWAFRPKPGPTRPMARVHDSTWRSVSARALPSCSAKPRAFRSGPRSALMMAFDLQTGLAWGAPYQTRTGFGVVLFAGAERLSTSTTIEAISTWSAIGSLASAVASRRVRSIFGSASTAWRAPKRFERAVPIPPAFPRSPGSCRSAASSPLSRTGHRSH